MIRLGKPSRLLRQEILFYGGHISPGKGPEKAVRMVYQCRHPDFGFSGFGCCRDFFHHSVFQTSSPQSIVIKVTVH